jgi:hypothetical protein
MIKLLLKLDGDSRQLEFTQDVITIGRSSDNILTLADKKASRKHARIEKIGNEYRLSDLESGNGTTVNGKPVVFHSLAKGDEISVGLTTLKVVDLDTPAPVAAPAAAPVAEAAPPPPPPAEPVAAAAPAAAPPSTRRHELRLRRRSSVVGNLVAAVIALAVLGALIVGVKHVADSKGQPLAAANTSKPAESAPSAAFVAEAGKALEELRQRAEGADAGDALIAEVTEQGEKYAGAYDRNKPSPFHELRDQLSQRRDAKFREKHAEAAGRVDAALQEHRYGDAIEAIKALRSTVDQSSEGAVGALLSKVTSEIRKDYKSVVGEGRKLEGQERHADAAEYYKQQAPRFKGTEFYKDLAERPELILAYAKAIAEAEANKPPPPLPKPAETEKPVEIVKVPDPVKPPDPVVEKPKENPIAKAPEPKPVAGKPATNKGAPPPPPKGAPPPPPLPGTTAPPPPPPSGGETAKADPKEAAKPAKPAPTGAIKGPPKQPDNACDCKKIIKGVYCETCKKELQPEDLRRSLCKKCEEKPKKIDLCVKRQYQADCHPNKVSDKPVS